jgi:hypothetical protein
MSQTQELQAMIKASVTEGDGTIKSSHAVHTSHIYVFSIPFVTGTESTALRYRCAPL